MNRRTISIFLLIIILIGLFLGLKYRQHKLALTKHAEKELGRFMLDLHRSKVRGVPADGRWYNCEGWTAAGDMSCLHVRRPKETPGILELQIQAENNPALKYTMKVRTLP